MKKIGLTTNDFSIRLPHDWASQNLYGDIWDRLKYVSFKDEELWLVEFRLAIIYGKK